MASFTTSESEELLARLVHDLRQPLGTIESSAYYMNHLLGREHTQAHEQIRIIERQVGHAVRILNEALAETQHLRGQHANAGAESLAAAKTAGAAVT